MAPLCTFTIVAMDEVEPKPRRRLGRWILAASVFMVGGLLVWATREPPTPYAFLNKHPIAERRESKDNKLRIVVLKANVEDVWQDIRAEFKGRSVMSSSGYVNINGVGAEYKSIGTEDGMVKVSNDLGFADTGHQMVVTTPEVKPGYCAVAFTRPKTIIDRALEWMHGFFRKERPPREESTAPPPVSISV